MNKFSLISQNEKFFQTGKEQVVDATCSKTGLSSNVVDKIYENQKLNGMIDSEISKYFDTIAKPKTNVSSQDFIEVLLTIFNEISPDKKDELVERFLTLFDDMSNIENQQVFVDSISLITTVRDILIALNPEAKTKLNNVVNSSILKDTDFKNLNESFDVKGQNTTKLYEGLKHILSKNNRRWGANYHLDNSYNTIMEYIQKEIDNTFISNNLQTEDNKYHLEIINDFLTGNVNPIYKSFSSAKHMVSDSQSLIFDMVLIINKYISFREEDLMFVNRKSFNEYSNISNVLLRNLYSSIYSSKVLYPECIEQLKTNTKVNNNSDNVSYYGDEKLPLERYLIMNIDTSRVQNNNVYNISLRGLIQMLDFISSASFEFNLKIRPILRTYINKTNILLNTVEKARIIKSKYEGNIS